MKMDLTETGCEDVDYVQLAHKMDNCAALGDMVMSPWIPLKWRNFLTD